MSQMRVVFCFDAEDFFSPERRPLMLETVLFCPVLRWMGDQMRADGTRRFFVSCPPEFVGEARACFDEGDDVIVSSDKAELLEFLQEDGFQLENLRWGMSEQQVRRAWRGLIRVDPRNEAEYRPADERILYTIVKVDGREATLRFLIRQDELYQISLDFADVALTEWPEQLLAETDRLYANKKSKSTDRAHLYIEGETCLCVTLPRQTIGDELSIDLGSYEVTNRVVWGKS